MAEPSENMKMLAELIEGKREKVLLYKGGTEGHCLYYGKDMAVQREFFPAGTKFEEHSHNATEILVVVSGKFFSTSVFIATDTPVAAVIIFPPHIPHSHFAETDCWIVGVLVPGEVGYPDGTENGDAAK
jgi:quercetin dioxygenase-like cupin family protein